MGHISNGAHSRALPGPESKLVVLSMLSIASDLIPPVSVAINAWQPGSTSDSLLEQGAKPAALATAEYNHWAYMSKESEQ